MTDPALNKILSNLKNLENVLDNLKDGIIAHDINRKIFYFNKEAERITGYARNEVLGKDCHDVFGSPLCGMKCSFCNTQPALKDRAEYSINIVSKSGETRTIDMSATMMSDENGKPFGVLASMRDNTDLLNLKIRAKKLSSFSNIISQDHKMLEVFQQIRDVAMYDSPVHIFGETGTGKELVAKAIHSESRRSGASFVPVNCGALPEGLIESELFGHVKGSFSGAIRDKKGRFELADKGTVFLDEVSELPKHVQVKLLRFLQEGILEKVGSERTESVAVRIISASNRNLKAEVQKNNFRDDLYYRLNVIPINLPPLRDRKNDIPLLCEHFIKQLEEKYGNGSYTISHDAMSLMMSYQWPGNVRELENTIQFSVIKCKQRVILPADLPMEICGENVLPVTKGASKKLDLDTVKSALEKTGGNKVKAAKIIGVGRATLYRFLNENPEVIPTDI